jgi:hypothetical protein
MQAKITKWIHEAAKYALGEIENNQKETKFRCSYEIEREIQREKQLSLKQLRMKIQIMEYSRRQRKEKYTQRSINNKVRQGIQNFLKYEPI